MRRAANIALLMVCLAMISASCKRSEPSPDYASVIEGTYTGTVTTGTATVAGTTVLVRRNDSKVDMHITAGSHNLDIYGVGISNSGNDVYYLTYAIVGNTLDGNVQGDQLTYTLTSGALNGTFTGSR